MVVVRAQAKMLALSIRGLTEVGRVRGLLRLYVLSFWYRVTEGLGHRYVSLLYSWGARWWFHGYPIVLGAVMESSYCSNS